MNDIVQDWINGLAGKVVFLDRFMRISASDLVYTVPLLLLALWFLPVDDRSLNQRLAAATFVALLLSLVLATGLGHLHQESRPFVSDSSTRLLIHHSADNSFPSEHAVLAFASGGVLIWWRRTPGLVVLLAALIVGISRVYVGVHWPLDILTSAVIGLTIGAFLARIVPLFATPQRKLAALLPSFLLVSP